MASLTYKKAGVNTELADELVEHIRKKSKAIGGFAGLFPLNLGPGQVDSYDLVACTDGVGTKLKIAFALDKHDTVGIDLVAMCANDLICSGAKPLFFLDYYATGRLHLARSKEILAGIMEGCRQARSALLGGETAEMPGMYSKGEYDLAGFSVGIVKRSEKIDGSKIFPGDAIMALPSSGLHSNGFSLVRRVFNKTQITRRGLELLTPTRIYIDAFDRLASGFKAERQIILGLAHITGGGLVENVPRILPSGCRAVFHKKTWTAPSIFREIQKQGNIPEKDMWTTFNMGLGLVFVVRPEAVDLALKLLPEARHVGEIVRGKNKVELKS
jgi:phosphoribosylformylglycinamidine cyclo-ligase